jgi:hypothetical protein
MDNSGNGFLEYNRSRMEYIRSSAKKSVDKIDVSSTAGNDTTNSMEIAKNPSHRIIGISFGK